MVNEKKINPELAIVIKDLYKSFPSGSGVLEVLKGVDLEIASGEIVAVVGTSGVGKSTLLHIIGLLDNPDRGSVFYNGVNLHGKKQDMQAEYRNKSLGFIFQFYHLMPDFTALENVMIPALLALVSSEEAQEKAYQMLKRVGLEHRSNHKPKTLSGGEMQRVAVARALINEPDFILADEPTGNLDQENAKLLLELISELVHEKKKTIIIVTHDKEVAAIAHRILIMKQGKIFNPD